jgi:ABC-type lipoprotein export system ATPase subunit
MNNDNAIIAVNSLVKHFNSGSRLVEAVDGVSFELPKGKIIAIKGASGSGKTTLMYLIGALEKPTSGDIIVDGIKVSELRGREETKYRLEKVGFIFQNYYLIPNLTALENVLLPMELLGIKKKERLNRAKELLEKVGINSKKQNRFPSRLSGGEQQRVAIARALANNPSVILADEPTGNLDTKSGGIVIKILQDLSEEGKTVIVSTHDTKIASKAEVVLEMSDGKIINTNV